MIDIEKYNDFLHLKNFDLSIESFTNKTLKEWMQPLISSFTPDGAIPYLINSENRYRASPLASTIIWLEKEKLLPLDVLDQMQNKLIQLRDNCQEDDRQGNYEKFSEDIHGWSLAEGVSVWSTSLSILALMDSAGNGIRKFDSFKDSIIWLTKQQDIKKKGWAYQAFENCEVNSVTTALSLWALAKVYNNCKYLQNEDEQKLILQSIINGFEYLQDTCVIKHNKAFWEFKNKPNVTATTWMLCALNEINKIESLHEDAILFQRKIKKHCFCYILFTIPKTETIWDTEKIVEEAGAKYNRQKNYFTFKPTLLALLFELGLSPFHPKVISQIKWLTNNPDSWTLVQYDKGEICSFSYAMTLSTIISWRRYTGEKLSSLLIEYKKNGFKENVSRLLTGHIGQSFISPSLLFKKNRIISYILLILVVEIFLKQRNKIIIGIGKIILFFNDYYSSFTEQEKRSFILSVLASILAAIIVSITIVLRKKILSFFQKITKKEQ